MIGYHFIAFITVAIWGSTFVFTKILLQNGLSPAQIFTLRFIIAYVLMAICCKVMSPRFKLLSNCYQHVAHRMHLSTVRHAALCHSLQAVRAH